MLLFLFHVHPETSSLVQLRGTCCICHCQVLHKVLSDFLNIDRNISNLIDYFDNYLVNLSNNTLNFYIKGVVKDKF